MVTKKIRILIYLIWGCFNLSAQTNPNEVVRDKYDLNVDSLNKPQMEFLNEEFLIFVNKINHDKRFLLNSNNSFDSTKCVTCTIENTVQQYLVEIKGKKAEISEVNNCKSNQLFNELVMSKINLIPIEYLDFWSYNVINSINFKDAESSFILLFHIDSHGFISNFYFF